MGTRQGSEGKDHHFFAFWLDWFLGTMTPFVEPPSLQYSGNPRTLTLQWELHPLGYSSRGTIRSSSFVWGFAGYLRDGHCALSLFTAWVYSGRGHAVNAVVKNFRALLLPNLCFFTSPICSTRPQKVIMLAASMGVHLWGLANDGTLDEKLMAV